MKHIDVSLILPCFNESEHFDESMKRIIRVLNTSGLSWEIILIDDHSTDDTAEKIKSFCEQNAALAIHAIYHSKNKGRGATVSEGIQKSSSEIVGFIDIDCEVDPQYIPQFVRAVQEGSDVVCAWRIYRVAFKSLLRYVASSAYVYIEQKLLHNNFPDTEAGYKFFRKKKIMPVLEKCSSHHWFWDTEIMVYSQKEGLSIQHLPVVFVRRDDKTSTVKIIPDTIDYIKNILRLRKEIL